MESTDELGELVAVTNSLNASTKGLSIVDRARQRRGWTKTSTARWWQDAHTSRATLRRFWRGERIQQDAFIAICQAVGINDWEAIAESPENLNVDLPELNSPLATSQVDWDEAPDLENFYGRTQELNQLEQWIVADPCKLVAIVGMGGIGKTALALALADRIQPEFEWLIWRSLAFAPSLFHLLDSLLYAFDQTVEQDIRRGIMQLKHQLQQRRCLLVLDGLDAVLQEKEQLEEYGMFLQTLSQTRHQSCMLLTSREPLPGWEANASNSRSVRCLTLPGLQKADALKLLQTGGFTGKELGLSALIRLYSGNPLALKAIAPLIQSIFKGNVAAFLNQNTLVLGDRLQAVLKQQFDRLSDSEREIVYWLAIWQEPVSLCRLQTHLLPVPDPSVVLAGIVALEKRSLIEKRFSEGELSLTLPPVVMKVVTDELVEQALGEISQVIQSNDICQFQVLRTHWLLRPGTDDIAGDRILSQLREKLWHKYGTSLPQVLRQILPLLQEQPPLVVGYISCNLMALLKQLEFA
ncbi:MAG TPA: NB-ARC domain-containing protein [Chroococcales cyanobacterium]